MGLAMLTLLSVWATLPAPENQKPDTPGKALSLAFKHYYDATSAAGQIRLTQSARGVSVIIDTTLNFDRPSLLYLQQLEPSIGKQWLSASDGKYFVYDRPPTALGRARNMELVEQNGRAQTVTMMYDASTRSIGDHSPALDIIFAGTEDLKALKQHWAKLRLEGSTQVRGRDVNVVAGDYCYIPGREPTGAFEADITDEGDLVRYVLKNRYGVPGQPGQIVEVTSVWDVDVKVGAANDRKIYQLRG